MPAHPPLAKSLMNHLVYVAAMVVSFLAGPTFAADWYRFRGPNLNGISTETDWSHQWPENGPEIAWTADVGIGFSSVSISDGRLYTIGNDENVDTIYCLAADTGNEIWRHSYSSPTDPNEFEGGPTSTPTVDGNRVYTLSRRGDLFALNKVSGEVQWAKNIATEAGVRVPAWGFSGSPLMLGDLLIANVGDAGVAVNKNSGELIWASDDKDAGYSSPVPLSHQGVEAVILGSARSYVCVDSKSGKELWRQRWLTTFGCNAADAIVSENQVFLSSGYNRGSALLSISSGDPETVWKHKDFQNQLSSSLLLDEHLYGASGDVASGANLACIQWSTGQVRWSNDSIRVGGISATTDGRLIILSDSGRLIIAAASPRKLEIHAEHQLLDGKCWTAPVLSGGRIFCRSADGQVVCADVRSPRASSASEPDVE